MGRVVRTVAKIAGVVALVATGAGAVFGAGALLAGASLGTIATVAGAVSLVAGTLGGSPKIPQSATQLGRLQATLNTQAPRTMILGDPTALAVDIRYYEGSGEDEEYVDYIIALAAHRIGGVSQIWFEDELAWSATGGVQGSYAGYLSSVTIRTEGTAANTIAINGGTRWGSDDRLTGCAYLRLRVKRTGNSDNEQSPLASGLPGRVTVIGSGMPMYDPRHDSTVGGSGTQRFDDQDSWGPSSNNPIIQALNVLIGWRINGKLSVGGGLPAKYLDLDSAITAANMCDEPIALAAGGTQPRYRTAGAFSTDDAPMNVVSALLAGCAGDLLDSEGRLSFLIKANTLATPSVTFDDHDVISGAQWDPMGGQTNLPNIISGSHVKPDALYQMAPYPSVRLASEDGIDRTAPVDFGVVENSPQSERLAKQTLQRMQYPGTFTAEYNMKGMAAKVGSIVWQSYSPRAWVNKPFRVVSQKPSRSGRIALVLREEHEDIYAWEANDSAPVQAAEAVGFDPRNSGPILLARKAAQTADWPKVTDSENTKPEDNATVGAPTGTPVGDRTADEVTDAIDRHETEISSNAANVAAANAAIDAAEQQIDDLIATYGSTASAAASANAAEQAKQAAEDAQAIVQAAEAVAIQARDDAQLAVTATESARDDAQADALAASGSAGVAAGHATTATTKADEAADSAAAASGSATAAQSSAAQASVSEGNAATSATNAADSASSAATSATTAANARDDAQGHASAASTSATNAAASAGEAATSASSSSTSANTAATKAGEASASAGQAASSASDAAGSATSASSFATLSASYRDQSLDNATKAGSSLVFNDSFDIVGHWYGNLNGVSAEHTSASSYASGLSRGNAFRTPNGEQAILVGKKFSVDTSRCYEVSAGIFNSADGARTYIGFVSYDKDGNYLSGNGGSGTWNAAFNQTPPKSFWHDYSGRVQGVGTTGFTFPAGTAFMAPVAYLNWLSESTGYTYVSHLRIDDVTSVVEAEIEAAAAISGAATATAKANEASTSASQAQSSQVAAGNSAAAAQTAATNASTSATSASAQAVLAAQYSDTAYFAEHDAELSKGSFGWTQLQDANALSIPALESDRSEFADPSDVLDAAVGGKEFVAYGTDAVVSRKAWPVDRSRRYRLTVRARRPVTGSGNAKFYAGIRMYQADGERVFSTPAWAGGAFVNPNAYYAVSAYQHPNTSSFVEFVGDFWGSDLRQDAAYMRLLMLPSNTGDSTDRLRLSLFRIEDITERYQANQSASAAATSATTAATKAGEASTSATAAQASANTATTKANEASSSASAASASATTAGTHAASASASTTLASTYADKAVQWGTGSPGLGINGEFTLKSNWYASSNQTNAHTADKFVTVGSGRTTMTAPNGTSLTIYGERFPVDTSRSYQVEADIFSQDGNARFYMGFAAYDHAGNFLSGNGGTNTYTAGANVTPPAGQWTRFSGVVSGEASAATNNKFPVGTKYIAPMAILNYQGTSNNNFYINNLFITDVTEVQNATAQAVIATSQATVATAQAAAAQSSSQLAAKLGAGGINSNPIFADYPGTSTPNNWQNWSAPELRSRHTVAVLAGESSPYAMDQGVTADNSGGVFQDTDDAAPGWYVLEATVKLLSGNLQGSGVYVRGTVETTQNGTLHFATDPDIEGNVIGNGAVGRTYRFSKLVKYDLNQAGGMRIFAMSAWNGFGPSSWPAKNIRWYKASFRAASKAEIDAQTVLPQHEASIATNAAVLATQASTLASLQTTVSSHGSSITSYATAISGINGDLDALFAKAGVKIDVNGRITGWEANDDGSQGNFVIHADNFSIEKPGGGARTEYSNGNWRIYDANGNLRVRMGVW